MRWLLFWSRKRRHERRVQEHRAYVDAMADLYPYPVGKEVREALYSPQAFAAWMGLKK